jgi:PDZ domain
MHRRHLIGLCVAVVAVASAYATGRGRPSPAAYAAGGEILLEGVTDGRYVDPFLDAAEALVHSEGYHGEFADLVGLSGLADEATMCRQDCECRELLHSAERLAALVAPLGGHVTSYAAGDTEPETAWEALEAELKAGRPVMAEGLEGPASLNLVVGCDPDSRTVVYLDDASRRESSFAEWTKGRWAMSAARLGTTSVPGPKAALDAIATMLVRARQPRIEGGCALSPERTQNAVGLEAYDLWTERASRGEPDDSKVQRQRLQAWVERRQMLVTFLRGAAQCQAPDTARRLQEAADAAQRELDQGIRPLAAMAASTHGSGSGTGRGPAITRRQRLIGLIRTAAARQREFLRKIEPIGFRHLRLSEAQRRLAALGAPRPTSDPAAVEASVRKLLQSRDGRVRSLGAMAAAKAGDPALAPELARELRSGDPLAARASLAALKTVNPPNLGGLLQQQADLMHAAGGKVGGDTDAIGKQVDWALKDLQAQQPGGPGIMAGLTRGPALFWIIGLAVFGVGLVAWKIVGPVRLANQVEAPVALRPGLPEEAARLASLLMRPPATGLLLTHVAPGELAFRQGLRPGDVICRYAGAAVKSLEDLRRLAAQPEPRQREVVARRDLRSVKTVVTSGPLGLNGVAVTRGKPFWRPLSTAPFVADARALTGEGEAWYGFEQNGRPIGFEWRRWRGSEEEVELCCIAGFAGDGGDESVRCVQKLRLGDRLTCVSTRFVARGAHPTELFASCTGGRWVVLVNGKPIGRSAPEEALPSHAIATFAATLPFEVGRAYDVVRVDELDFQPSYGCQIVCLGPEMISGGGGHEKAWRFELMEYGVRQMAFWLNPARQLVRAEYAGLVSTLTTREGALAGLPPSLSALAEQA